MHGMDVYGNPSMSSRVTGSKPRKWEEGTALVHITRFPPQSSIFLLVSFFSVGKESEVSALGWVICCHLSLTFWVVNPVSTISPPWMHFAFPPKKSKKKKSAAINAKWWETTRRKMHFFAQGRKGKSKKYDFSFFFFCQGPFSPFQAAILSLSRKRGKKALLNLAAWETLRKVKHLTISTIVGN